MSLYNGPPRPGARGGRDQFNWENVKSDKDREFYLGHSVKATTGRWQKGKDVFWYTREKDDTGIDPRQDEIALVKQREEELMMEALGMKPKTVRAAKKPQLSQQEMKKLLEGNPDEPQEGQTEDQPESDRIGGLGFQRGAMIGAGEAEHETLAGVGMNRPRIGNPGPALGSTEQALPLPPNISASELRKIKKHQAKEAKRQRKAEKKAKKEAKKERKAAKRKHADSDERPVKKSKKAPARHDSLSERSSSSSSDSEPDERPYPNHKPEKDLAAAAHTREPEGRFDRRQNRDRDEDLERGSYRDRDQERGSYRDEEQERGRRGRHHIFEEREISPRRHGRRNSHPRDHPREASSSRSPPRRSREGHHASRHRNDSLRDDSPYASRRRARHPSPSESPPKRSLRREASSPSPPRRSRR